MRQWGINFGCWLRLTGAGVLLCAVTAFSYAQTEAASQNTVETAPPDGAPETDPIQTMFPRFRDTRFWLTGQANFIFQTHPPFDALYSGKNSLNPNYEKAVSRVLTLYTGVRLNESTEILVDIEEAGGSALSTGLGLAGNPDLDIVRNPSLSKAPYLARGMIHKVFALSDDKIENERSPLSLFEKLPRRRLELRFGKFSMVDFFDQNSVGSDTKFQFANWTVDNNGAYDYAADTRGYTVGLTLDYEDRNWGFRFAEALMPKVANGIDLVWKPWQVHSENFEYELRHGVIPKKAGVVRILAYTNCANMGIYRDAVAQFEKGLMPVPDITNHSWHITRKYGFGLNLEQNIARNLTAFGRFGWGNGKTARVSPGSAMRSPRTTRITWHMEAWASCLATARYATAANTSWNRITPRTSGAASILLPECNASPIRATIATAARCWCRLFARTWSSET